MKTRLLLFFAALALSLASICTAQVGTYTAFKSLFRDIKSPISIGTFIQSKFSSLTEGELVARSKYRDFIPYKITGADPLMSMWLPGEKLELDEYDVVHLLTLQHPEMLYGPLWVDNILATFQKDGTPIDACVVLRSTDYQEGSISGTLTPYQIKTICEYSDSNGYTRIEYITYTIDKQGKIVRSKTPLGLENIKDELQGYHPIDKALRIDWEAFTTRQSDTPRLATDEMPKAFAERYMPMMDKARLWKWYRGGKCSLGGRYTILLSHATGEARGWEESSKLAWVLSVLAADGTLTDQVVLGVDSETNGISTHGYLPDNLIVDCYKLPSNRFELTKETTVFTRTSYSITPEGKITQSVILRDSSVHTDSLSRLNRLMGRRW